MGDKVPLILGNAYREYYKVGDKFGGDYFLFPEDTTYEVVGFTSKNAKYYNLNLSTYISLDHYILVPDVDIDENNAYRKEVIIANYAQRIPGLLLSNEDTYLDLAIIAIPMGLLGARLYYVLFKWLTSSFVYIEMILHLSAFFIILNIVRTSRHLSSDLMWIIMIMLFPVFGTFVYIIMVVSLIFGKTFRNIITEQKKHPIFLC